ncbi:flagellar biosynthesis anti-sigma factor FlgM [Oceanobacillus alkalisoli]|uniref:flagellar biosynthesis anti-sigma factor FlgM n=1 Tax=Oceanobacillus alkalisoli TaxID=2925113 RepID=UPI001EE40AAA|nr:flagellar biosynthesis anti-sigma factor FlgM [Oceanobacillus alkalisoli]MCG5104028.1 flagellar biosynthesis anti-sigma factor FlgM [Oceanobacillus alkalisoli]
MKINRSNQLNFNPYKQQLQKQTEMKKAAKRSDELQISKEALKLQEKDQPNNKRAEKVQEIKKQIENGEYKMNHEVTAQKMLDFWTK